MIQFSAGFENTRMTHHMTAPISVNLFCPLGPLGPLGFDFDALVVLGCENSPLIDTY